MVRTYSLSPYQRIIENFQCLILTRVCMSCFVTLYFRLNLKKEWGTIGRIPVGDKFTSNMKSVKSDNVEPKDLPYFDTRNSIKVSGPDFPVIHIQNTGYITLYTLEN